MKKIFLRFLIAIGLGLLITAGTYFYQREIPLGGGICMVGVISGCNGSTFSKHGYPKSFLSSQGPVRETNIQALLIDIIFWSATAFTILQIIQLFRKKDSLLRTIILVTVIWALFLILYQIIGINFQVIDP